MQTISQSLARRQKQPVKGTDTCWNSTLEQKWTFSSSSPIPPRRFWGCMGEAESSYTSAKIDSISSHIQLTLMHINSEPTSFPHKPIMEKKKSFSIQGTFFNVVNGKGFNSSLRAKWNPVGILSPFGNIINTQSICVQETARRKQLRSIN